MSGWQRGARAACRWLWLLALSCCASIPSGSYGIDRLRLHGVNELDPAALQACLATEERPRLTLGMSALREPVCGQPPFDRARLSLHLFSWAWTDWPIYDEGVFRLDLERITRWYRARGYYGAQILAVQFTPPKAADSDTPDCRGCELAIDVTVSEGEPVRIQRLELEGFESLPRKLEKEVRAALGLKVGEIFDEAKYEQARTRLLRVLREAGHAQAEVTGDVLVNAEQLSADVKLSLKPGAVWRLGQVRVSSSSKVADELVLGAAQLRSGRVFKQSDLEDAERAVYALGAFSLVRVSETPRPDSELIDVEIEVEPRRESQWLFGGGIMSGILSSGVVAPEWISIPQWDVHLSGSYENRNFFGGLRRLRIEERPRLIFLGPFPDVPRGSPRFGNQLRIVFSQPGVLEPRTSLFSDFHWDEGPDPFLLFFRNDLGLAVGLQRAFWRRRVETSVAAHQDLVFVSKRQPLTTEAPSSYVLPFLEQRASLDLRDVPTEPTKGAYFSLAASEAFKLGRSWNYLRLIPDARVYAPLGLGIVLAARFAVGWLKIFKASSSLDPTSQELGPFDYRLRGGGAQSNRGFLPGQLGNGVQGGTKRWESSVELRVPVTHSLTAAFFTDMGNVAIRTFGFRNLNTAIGGGLRYRTIVGPIRVDVGWRPPKLQNVGGGPGSSATSFFGRHFHGAVAITVGEPF